MKKLFFLILLTFVSLSFGQDYSRLSVKIQEVCPIKSIYIGNMNDKSTWTVQYSDLATNQQKIDAQNIITNWTESDWEPILEKRLKKLYTISKLNNIRDGLAPELTYWNNQPASPKRTAILLIISNTRQNLQDQIDTIRSNME